jgi:hypothetical protein
MNTYCIDNLLGLKKMLEQISESDYIHKSHWLSGSSIGQHVRHILEFYTCLLDGLISKTVNYDERNRVLELEINSRAACQLVDLIVVKLLSISDNDVVYLKGRFSVNDIHSHVINTSLNRELAYCLEHCIHHQALIKVALHELNQVHLVSPAFGLAPATQNYQSIQLNTIFTA